MRERERGGEEDEDEDTEVDVGEHLEDQIGSLAVAELNELLHVAVLGVVQGVVSALSEDEGATLGSGSRADDRDVGDRLQNLREGGGGSG